MALETRRTCITACTDPLDANPVADLTRSALGARTHLHDLAHAFVSADLALLRRRGERVPSVRHDAEVGVADAGVGEVDEDLAGTGLGSGEFFDFGGDATRVVVDRGFVGLGDLGCRHDGWVEEVID